LLEINDASLVYGSADGAITVVNSSREANSLMDQLATKVNLKRI